MNMKFEGFLPEQANYVDVLYEQYLESLSQIDLFIEQYNNTPLLIKSILSSCEVLKYKPDINQIKTMLLMEFWERVYTRSNISQYLDSDKKSKWESQFLRHNYAHCNLPEFTPENIIATLKEWYESKDSMFLDRISLVFERLSGDHVTNKPYGFSEKMIFKYGASFNEYSKTINVRTNLKDLMFDLACCISMLLKRPMPERLDGVATSNLQPNTLYAAYGDYFKFKVFKSGTLHLWIHEDIAIDLNIQLAKKYPSAIASKHRQKSKDIKSYEYGYDPINKDDKKLHSWLLSGNYAIRLSDLTQASIDKFLKYTGLNWDEVKNNIRHGLRERYKEMSAQILRNGYPSVKDHQFYPTPQIIVDRLMGEIGTRIESDEITVLEPSAGYGALVQGFTNSFKIVTAIEVDPFLCSVLAAKGMNEIHNIDFLRYKAEQKFDLILMNPPYSDRRLEKHFSHALTFMADGGELYIIAPSGKEEKLKEIASNKSVTALKQFDGAFEDTKISTTLFLVS